MDPQRLYARVISCKISKGKIFNKFYTTFNNKSNYNNFGSYISGLIEGDGTIFVPETERSPKGNLNYPCISIVFNLRDFPLAQLIQKELGTVSLSRVKGVNAYLLQIKSLEGNLKLVNLLNGNMRTSKMYRLYDLINWLNNKNSDLNIMKLPLDSSHINSNAWLSGFIEADGHFRVRTTTISKYPRVECKFELSQIQMDQNGHNKFNFLEMIANFLLCSVKAIRVNKPNPQYKLRTTSLNGNLILENYLNTFPLFGSKYLDYKDWTLASLAFAFVLIAMRISIATRRVKDQREPRCFSILFLF
jgi:LAGLIDADG endonuclease